VYFPDENHWILKPQNSLFWYETKRQWLEQYVPPGPTEMPTEPSADAPLIDEPMPEATPCGEERRRTRRAPSRVEHTPLPGARMNRREVLQATAAATLATIAGARLLAKEVKPMRILILGGTGFIGPHIVNACRERGHTLTLFTRGKRNAWPVPDLVPRLGDRDGKLGSLNQGDWDVVIDNSGYVPRHVRLSAELLEPRIGRYIFVSSISAYADLSAPGIKEDHPTAKLADPAVEHV